mgnify:CR=1 FL=1
MARITIVPDDNIVHVDGEARTISMAGIDPTIHAVQWFGDVGEVEFNDGSPHATIINFAPFQVFVTRWAAAAPVPLPPPTLDELKTVKQGAFVTEGVNRIAAEVPDLDTLESIKAIAAIWPEIGAGARATLTKAKDIYLYFRNTVPPKIAVIATEADLATVDPTAADPFGDGTLWPE